MTDPVSIYEAWFVPAVFAPLARQVAGRVAIAPDARVLDVACGTGIVARTIARRVGREGHVAGVDISPAMLSAAQKASEAEGLAIAWQHGSAQALPFDNGAFDLVVCQHGLQFMPDRAAALSEMRRVLAPGGQAIIVTWRGLDQNPLFAAFDRALRSRFDAPAVEIPFSLGDPAELGSLLLNAGFANVAVEPIEIETDYAAPERFIEYQTIASAAAIPSLQTLDAVDRETLIAGLREALDGVVREATAGGRLRFPMQGIMARGTRR